MEDASYAPKLGRTHQSPAWNTGRIIGPKPPLKPRHIWAIRTRLQHGVLDGEHLYRQAEPPRDKTPG